MTLFDHTGYAVWGVAAALLHEGGHIVMMALKKSPPTKIIFGIFNVDMIDSARESRSYRDDVQILIAGGAVNLIAAFIFFFISKVTNNQYLFAPLFSNLFVGSLNILPVEPLDGGQIAYALISAKYGARKAETAVNILSFCCLLPVAVMGFLILLQSKYNFSLLFISCYLMAILLFKRNKYY